MKSKTVIVQIGNSDDKLTQARWSSFVEDIHKIISYSAQEIHFASGSPSNTPWQNYCWVFDILVDELVFTTLTNRLSDCRKIYNQDSIAVTQGVTMFV